MVKALGEQSLRQITADVILEYRANRKARGLSNVTINIEVGALRRILKRGKLWQRMADDVKPLKEQPSEVGRAMSPEQKQRLLEVASTNPSVGSGLLCGHARIEYHDAGLRNSTLEMV